MVTLENASEMLESRLTIAMVTRISLTLKDFGWSK
jgi:hypothetical protein